MAKAKKSKNKMLLSNMIAVSSMLQGDAQSDADGESVVDIEEFQEEETETALDPSELQDRLHEAFLSYDEWYRPDTSRSDVDKILTSVPDGSFIVRASSQSEHKALCVKFTSVVLHYLIEK